MNLSGNLLRPMATSKRLTRAAGDEAGGSGETDSRPSRRGECAGTFNFEEEWKAMQIADAKITKALAQEIAADVPVSATWDQTRDLVDLATGDLDCWQLDRLTDWVSAIVHPAATP